MWLEDPYWLRAGKCVAGLLGDVKYVLAPAEMNHLRGDCLPLAFAHILEPDQCAIVLPKDDVDMLPLSWIEQLPEWETIYADGAFVALKAGANGCVPHPDDFERAYLHRRGEAVLGGQAVRQSRIDEQLSDKITSGPYAVVAAASMTGNAGDRLIASAAARLLRKAWPHLSILIVDGSPDRTLIANASAVVIGPGGMIYDYHRSRIELMNVANWMRFGYLAQEYRVPLFSIGIGHQMMITDIAWRYTEGALREARIISTRDRDTAKLLLNRVNCPVVAMPDISTIFAEEIRHLPGREGERKAMTICGDFRHTSELARTLVNAGAAGCLIRYIVQANEDAESLACHRSELQEAFGDDFDAVDCRTADPMVFCAAIASSDAIVTTRFHGMMVAMMAGVDTLVFTDIGDKRERVRDEVGPLPWVRFHRGVDLEAAFSSLCELIQSGRRDINRAVHFEQDGFSNIAEHLKTALRIGK